MPFILSPSGTSPFKGAPFTRAYIDKDGNQCFAVTAHALHPFWARVTIYAAIASAIAMFVAGIVGLAMDGGTNFVSYGIVPALSGLAFFLVLFGLRLILRSTVKINLTPDQVHIRKSIRSRSFERSHPLGFVLLPHDKAEKERERHAFLDRKYPPRWWSWKRKKFYGASYHVALTCFGERYDILTVYGEKNAKAIQARLKACDAVVDGAQHGDGGIALSPDTEWGAVAGSL